MSIDPQELRKLFLHCMFRDEEVVDGQPIAEPVVAEGIRSTVGFHPGRLAEAKPQIEEMISHLDDKFKEGWSFLNLCVDKNGHLWTGEHQVCEQLVQLGVATKLISYVMPPREFWSAMPGGMPYVVVKEVAAEDKAPQNEKEN